MTEHKLSEQDLQEIRKYAWKLLPTDNRSIRDITTENSFKVVDLNEDHRNILIAALTREREMVKPVIEALEFIEMNYGDHDAVRDKIRQTLNNYKNNK